MLITNPATQPSTQSESQPAPRRSRVNLILTALVGLLSVLMIVVLLVGGLVPLKFVVPAAVLLVLITLAVFLLTRKPEIRSKFILGTFLGIVTSAVLLYGLIALLQIAITLGSITTTRTEISYVGVYVLMEDPAQELTDLQGETFGILSDLDRTSTDAALTEIEAALSETPTTAEYAGLTLLVDALYDQTCRAIVLNAAYLDVLEELDGYEDILERIRELCAFEVQTTVALDISHLTDGNLVLDDLVLDDSSGSSNVFTVYISGIDSRTGLTSVGRSDVNILATVNLDTHQILLISTPRDYYVELSISNGAKDKLTHAGIYGIQVSMDTLGMLYDVDVEYYFKVCFEGVVGIVDALGGVNVYSEYDFTAGSYSFTVGYNQVDGNAALAFCRERHAFSSGDRQRGKNQMAMIRAIIKKAIAPSILVQYSSILSSVESNFETNIPYDMIASLVNQQLASAAEWEVITYSVDGSNGSAVPYSSRTTAYVMIPDETTVATAKSLMQAVLNGEKITQPTG